MQSNHAKEQLKRDKCIYGMFCNSASPELVEIMSLSGLDFIMVDSEHAFSSPEKNRHLVMAGECHDCPVFIRPPNGERSTLLRNLDIGALGLLVPQVNSRAEAESVVHAAKYYPEGMRGVALARSAEYGMSCELSEYFARENQELLLAVQCENVDCIPELDSIAAVPGIDVIFIGPFDLSQSLNIPGQVESAEVMKVVDRVLTATRKNHIHAGIFVTSVEQAKKYADLGFRYIIIGSDISCFCSACKDIIASLGN